MFAIYQWGVETAHLQLHLLHHLGVRNLPMRSWNLCAEQQKQEEEQQVRNLPMRSWNNNSLPYLTSFTMVRNLPMRSWNNHLDDSNEIFMVGVRNLPMRSWNIHTNCGLSSFTKCSQFTNEELKLCEVIVKFFGRWKFAIYQWGVETGRKELSLKFISLFAIYQWGVETLTDGQWLYFSYQRFAIYQWGVETSFSIRWNNLLLCSQFTNEESKFLITIIGWDWKL